MATQLLQSGVQESQKPPVGWESVMDAAEVVRQRMYKTAAVLEAAGIPYAVIGGNAVASWVGRVNPNEARMTFDVDIILRRQDLPAAIVAMEANGFKYRKGAGIHMFLEGPKAKARQGVHVLFAGEKVRPEYTEPSALVEESVRDPNGRFNHITLDALVRMKLISFRRKDQVHIEDMIRVGLIDASWLVKLPPSLAPRLKEILDNPEPDLGIELDADESD